MICIGDKTVQTVDTIINGGIAIVILAVIIFFIYVLNWLKDIEVDYSDDDSYQRYEDEVRVVKVVDDQMIAENKYMKNTLKEIGDKWVEQENAKIVDTTIEPYPQIER